MKKLIDFIMSKERENDVPVFDKKPDPKAKKTQASQELLKDTNEPNDLFWDDYSDVGYC